MSGTERWRLDVRNAGIVFRKQVKDTAKNVTVLLQFVIYPIIAAAMENAVHVEDLPENFFVGMFAVMYISMAPLSAAAVIISEEKEKNTMRMLLYANVRPMEYLCGVGGFVFSACMFGSGVFAVLGGYTGNKLLAFLLIMAAGTFTSILFGAAIGIRSRNQTAATSISIPIMMIFAFLPMLAMFNKNIEKAADLVYSQHIQRLLNGLGTKAVAERESVIIIAVNNIVAVILFALSYRQKGLT